MRWTMNTRFFWSIVCVLMLAQCAKDDSGEVQIETGTVTDHEGREYKTVKIGDQWWMAENLAVTTFNDGTGMEFLDVSIDDTVWFQNEVAKYTSINEGRSGLLYSSQVLLSGRTVAPEGWHVATDEDWKKLENYIGMEWKEVNGTGWRGNEEAELLASKYSVGWPAGIVLFGLNKYGFNALPTGCRTTQGFTNISSNTAFWWSPTGDQLHYRYVDAENTRIFRQVMPANYALAIRCVKN